MTTMALLLGIALAYLFQPGVGMNIDPNSLDASSLKSYVDTAAQVKGGGTVEFLMKLIPTTFVGAIAFTVGKYGAGSLKQLGYLVVLFYATVFLFVVVVLGAALRLAGFSIFKLIRYLRDELLIVLGTASSDSVLPQVMRKLEKMGIKDSTVGLVIPTGYSFNLDAFSIYLTLAAIFIAQATNTPLSFTSLLVIIGVALITSKGALGNLIGNCVATVVVAAWEKDIDKVQARNVLDGRVEVDLDEHAEDLAPLLPAPAQAV
jgi:aerobic C4-dicarboxylate transport protein